VTPEIWAVLAPMADSMMLLGLIVAWAIGAAIGRFV